MAEMTRTFIAIDFPDEVIKEVARVQELVEGKRFMGKFTELENLHLTLKFLGEIDDSRVEKVREKLREIEFSEMDLTLGELGTFSLRGNPKIVWIKINGEAVWSLQKKIDSALMGLFEPEERFMSHLTIARLKYVEDKKGFSESLKAIHVKKIGFKCSCFRLMKSELRKMGPTYSCIEEYLLKGEKYKE